MMLNIKVLFLMLIEQMTNFFFVYVGHVGIEGWFNEEENQEDEHDSCIEGMENI